MPTPSESSRTASSAHSSGAAFLGLARRELDSAVVNVELTLTSIIQGVALYFLTDNAREPLGNFILERWIYIANGLLIIFLFWSRSVIHTLTLLRWPLQFSHNFLYIACTLFEAISFAELGDPIRWYAFQTVFAVTVWILFIVDLDMVRERVREATGTEAAGLYDLIQRDQLMNIRWLVPAFFCFFLAAVILTVTWPELFLQKRGHVAIGACQFVSLLGYLVYLLRSFARLAPLIPTAQAVWRAYAAQPEAIADSK
ncbi:MAG: hypothetical protein WB586_23910 [Chthoniobacterales bacterium]